MSVQEKANTGAKSAPGPQTVAFASFVGTAIEWYDFFIFGTASALIFSVLFFPDLDPVFGLLASFATFGVAFVARPIGAVVFGHYGDRIGRKRMLIISLLLMGGATVLIGLLPAYHQIGIWAPVLLVIFRLVQGFAVGGEWGGAVLMAVEHAPPTKRSFYGSWPQAGVPAGLVLSTGAFVLVQMLPEDAMMSWGWRLPFLASALLVLVGLFVRFRLVESPEFEDAQREKRIAKLPLAELFKTQKRPLVIGILAQATSLVPFYIVTVFLLSYAPAELGVESSTLLVTLLIACLIDIVTVPLAAIIADKIGARNMLVIGSAYMIAAAFPFFWLLSAGSALAVFFAMFLMLPIGHAVTYSAVAGYVTRLFPAEVRYSGASIAYQLGGVVFSAPAPFVATWLGSMFAGEWSLALYIMIAALITLVALQFSTWARTEH